MNAADRILLRLDAHDCWAPRISASPEKVVVRRGAPADFGTIAGQQTIAELQDIMTSWAYRMEQLAQAYANFAPVWVGRDPAGFTDWTNDWAVLQNRYNAAMSAAQSAVTAAKFNLAIPNSMISAQAEFTGLAKAMRQCYPPDGCPTVKGDFVDLDTRLTAAARAYGSAGASYANMPQPKATDADQQAFAATAPLDVVAQVTGLQKTGPLPPAPGGLSWLAWIEQHKTALLVGGAVIAGGVVLAYVAPVLGLLGKSVHGIAALAA